MTNTLLLHFQSIFQVWILWTHGYLLLEYFWQSAPPWAEWMLQKRPCCSDNNLASKGSCETQGTRQMHLTGWWDFLLKLSVTVRIIPSPPLSRHLNYTAILHKCPRKELELATNISATHGLMLQILLFSEVAYRALLFDLSWGDILKLSSRQQQKQ